MAQSDAQQVEPTDVVASLSPSRRARRSSRTRLPWIWLTIAFLVVLIFAAVLYLASGNMPGQPLVVEPTVTPTVKVIPPTPTMVQPSSTPAPTVEPPTATPEPSPSELEIGPGIEVRIIGTGIDGLSFRSGPGTNYARLRMASDGETFTVVEGPQEADGYRWWRLQDETGTMGWAAENWLQPVGQ